MSNGERYPFDMMLFIAEHLRDYLAPAVHQCDVAGSVRRHNGDPKRPQNATCGDIELVLDGDRDTVMTYLNAAPTRYEAISGGERLVKFTLYLPARGRDVRIPVQLNFATTLTSLLWGTVSNYGWKLLLATGDAEWNQFLVLNRKHGGLKPDRIHKAEKSTASTISTIGFLHINTEPQHTPTEQHVFDLYGIPFVEPHRRTGATARELRVALATQGVL